MPARPESPTKGAKAPEDEAKAPTVVPKAATRVGPNTVVVEATDDPNELPGMNQKRYPPKSEGDPAKKPGQKIDNALLEKLMKSRNGSP